TQDPLGPEPEKPKEIGVGQIFRENQDASSRISGENIRQRNLCVAPLRGGVDHINRRARDPSSSVGLRSFLEFVGQRAESVSGNHLRELLQNKWVPNTQTNGACQGTSHEWPKRTSREAPPATVSKAQRELRNASSCAFSTADSLRKRSRA